MIQIKTGRPEFDELPRKVESFLAHDVFDVVIDGHAIRGYRTPDAPSIWIRDLSDMMRGFKYFETDLLSAVEHFAATQAHNGRIFDYFTTHPEKLPSERENWTKYVRVPVEADVEYRFVKAAFLAWQATANDTWIQRLLPRMERAMEYALTHPWRWDSEHELVKRAYTIDTWDFAYDPDHEWLQFQINHGTNWGIMHGDNSGYQQAFRHMALLHDTFKNGERADHWGETARALKRKMNAVCWNGTFYTHFVKLTPVDIPGVDEAKQLSLSNPMDINRGAATHEMAVSIIEEYLRRRDEGRAFAEWYSIDPPFPDGVFGDERLKAGAYVNGGIMPLVGGELARAALEHGFEDYGVDILERYYRMIDESGETYLWYHPDGTPASLDTSTSPDAQPTDGWGSTAMLYALVEGLAGVEDRRASFQSVRLAPRWLAASGVDEAEVRLGYPASGAEFGYAFRRNEDQLLLDVEVEESDVLFHVLLPPGTRATSVTVNGNDIDYRNATRVSSSYVDFKALVRKRSSVKIQV